MLEFIIIALFVVLLGYVIYNISDIIIIMKNEDEENEENEENEEDVKMSKWNYIEKISAESDKDGDKLQLLMDKYNKTNLRDITLEEAKEFWEENSK